MRAIVSAEGDSIAVDVRLSDTRTGNLLLEEHYEGAWPAVFSIQQEITGDVAAALPGIDAPPPPDLAAQRMAQRGSLTRRLDRAAEAAGGRSSTLSPEPAAEDLRAPEPGEYREKYADSPGPGLLRPSGFRYRPEPGSGPAHHAFPTTTEPSVDDGIS